MSKQADKESVFLTTKVRTKLKGDGSWLQQRNEAQGETNEEKPWLAEVRAGRLNGEPVETSPASSPTTSTPPDVKADAERTPASGFLIRGVFTKLESPTLSSTSNGVSQTATQFPKKPSESYKKIAPYTVRPTAGNQEAQLSSEEQEKRTEAASSVLMKSAVRQRSYVLSAAKKYETQDMAPETSLANSSPAFVARRVETVDDDDDESAATPAPASNPPTSPAAPVTSVAAAAPEPKPAAPAPVLIPECFQAVPTQPEAKASAFSGRVNTPLVDLAPAAPSPASSTPAAPVPSTPVPLTPAPVSPVKTEAKPEFVPKPAPQLRTQESAATPAPASNPPTSPAPPVTSVAVAAAAPEPKPAAPAPVLMPECFQAVPTQPEAKASAFSGRVNTPLVDLAPAAPSPASPTPAAPVPSTPVPRTPAPVSPVKTEAKPEFVPKPAPQLSSGVDTLTNLSNTLITFNSSSTSFVDDAPVLAEEEAGSANSHTTENGDEEEADPELGSREPLTDDLLAFTDGPEESRAEPVPPSPGRWSQDLLKSELNSESKKKTSGPLDLLANDVIPINPEARRLNVQRKEEKRTDETAGDTQSLTETVTITTKTVIITDKSSADPFDPYPIGTTSSNSSSDLLQPESDVSNNSHVLDSHSDLISINTDATSSQRTWARTWQTSPPQQENNEESQEALPAAQMLDEETLVRFERKSAENDSPWDRWTSPTVYTLPVTTGEEEEEEEEAESTEYKQTETVTTITTIRERLSEEQPVVDRYETYSRSVTEEDQRVLTPEPEAKRGFVYLKEYVNATELSLHNARDTPDSGSDYVTSSSTSYSYNSPSTYSSGLASSTCNFCGEQVGNDAKITIEHLNINCHPRCFQCGVCKKPMGDLLDSMFLHGGKVHCESCYSEALD
uniref:zinc finger protein 185 isoform X7 n=1 Tax=Gasterosteus aculeatus aculeatus TaxID=481459 RepID=UPI001A985846|nr:zinc finger protein 185 isoform X7 [Gasterosteus aculeatus aculeatus]